MQSLEARAALGGFFALASYITASSRWIHRGAQKSFDRAVNIAFVLSRLGLYVLTFLVLHLAVRGDVPTFYVLPARAALQHKLPYIDYPTSYAPLHATLDAGLLLLWNSPLAIILFAILAECFLLPVWLRVSRQFLSESTVRIAAVLYLTSAMSVQFVTIDGQDNAVLAVLLGLALLLLARHRAVLSGAVLAAGAVVIKFLPLFFAPAFFLVSNRRWRWLAGFAAVLFLGYGYFVLRHVPILFPFYFEHTSRTASDLPYVLEALVNVTPPSIIEDGIFGVSLLIIIGLLARIGLRRPDRQLMLRAIIFGCVAIDLAVLIFSRKSWPPYIVLTLFPLGLLFGEGSRRRLRLACFALFNLLGVTSHSIWATVFGQFLAGPLHQAIFRGHQGFAAFFLFTQIALVAGYAWLLIESIDAMLSPTPASAPHQPAAGQPAPTIRSAAS
jgi:hypothetical protein